MRSKQFRVHTRGNHDGGRHKVGFPPPNRRTGDCAARAVCNFTGRDYGEVWQAFERESIKHTGRHFERGVRVDLLLWVIWKLKLRLRVADHRPLHDREFRWLTLRDAVRLFPDAVFATELPREGDGHLIACRRGILLDSARVPDHWLDEGRVTLVLIDRGSRTGRRRQRFITQEIRRVRNQLPSKLGLRARNWERRRSKTATSRRHTPRMMTAHAG